jgi:hypothetical protein
MIKKKILSIISYADMASSQDSKYSPVVNDKQYLSFFANATHGQPASFASISSNNILWSKDWLVLSLLLIFVIC